MIWGVWQGWKQKEVRDTRKATKMLLRVKRSAWRCLSAPKASPVISPSTFLPCKHLVLAQLQRWLLGTLSHMERQEEDDIIRARLETNSEWKQRTSNILILSSFKAASLAEVWFSQRRICRFSPFISDFSSLHTSPHTFPFHLPVLLLSPPTPCAPHLSSSVPLATSPTPSSSPLALFPTSSLPRPVTVSPHRLPLQSSTREFKQTVLSEWQNLLILCVTAAWTSDHLKRNPYLLSFKGNALGD